MEKTKVNIIYSVLYRIVSIVLPLVTSPYIARVIGADGIGVYNYYNSIAFYFFSFAMLGINTYGCREIAKCKDGEISHTFWQLYYMQFFTSIVLTGLYLLIAFIAFDSYRNIALIIAIYILSGVFDIDWFAFGLEKFKLTSLSRIFSKLLILALVFIFVKSETDLWKYALILQLGNIISFAWLWPLVFKSGRIERPNFAKIKKHLKKNIILFLPVIAASAYQYMDKIMIGSISTNAEVGYYNYAENIFAMMGALTIAVSTVLLTKSSKKHNSKNNASVEYKSFEYVTMVNSAIAFGIMSVGNIFIPVFLGDGYERTSEILFVLAPVLFVYGLNELMRMQIMIPRDMDKQFLFSIIYGAIANIIFNAITIPFWGAMGAAAATVVAYVVTMLVQFFYTRKIVSYRKIISAMLPYSIFGIVMYMMVTMTAFDDNIIVNLLLKIVLGALVYATLVIIYRLFFRRNERFERNNISRW